MKMLASKRLMVLMAAAALSGGAFAANYVGESSDDAQLRAAVQKQIDEQPTLKFDNISVRSFDHVVYLNGLVESRTERHQAIDIAAAVPGVKKVYSSLALNND
jgi:osmotically-inducible protein OsmY